MQRVKAYKKKGWNYGQEDELKPGSGGKDSSDRGHDQNQAEPRVDHAHIFLAVLNAVLIHISPKTNGDQKVPARLTWSADQMRLTIASPISTVLTFFSPSSPW